MCSPSFKTILSKIILDSEVPQDVMCLRLTIKHFIFKSCRRINSLPKDMSWDVQF